MGSNAEEVHPAGVYFHDEQRVQACERDRVDMEEVRGQKPTGLGCEERTPLAMGRVALWWRPKTGAAEYPAHGGRADPVPEATQLAVHPTEAPAGILRAKLGDELVQLVCKRRASWGRGLSPLPLDQTLVPGQQGAGRNDPVAAQSAGEQPGEGGKQCPIGPAGAGRV